VLLFAPVGEHAMAGSRGMSVGVMSAAQGAYSQSQLLLDITQGARIATSAYPRPQPPALALRAGRGSGVIAGWGAALARAGQAPAQLQPGLLAASIPGGGAYASAGPSPDAPAAAGERGALAAVSIAQAATLAPRIQALARTHGLVVADLPAGPAGTRALSALADERPAGELLIVVQRVGAGAEGTLLWTSAAGLQGGPGRRLSSPSTTQAGLISSVDLAPTILAHLRMGPEPETMTGRVITASAGPSLGTLASTMQRLRVIGARRLPALAFLLAGWLLILLACARRPSARARAIRSGALGVLWAPVAAMAAAALEPSAAAEYALIPVLCLALGAASDALIAWPRGAIAPAAAATLAIVVDALAGSQLLMRSLLGPDPFLGARFYGIGNELKSALAVLVLAAVAGALYPSTRGRRAALWMLGCGVVLAAVEGSARIGAAVGGVILVCAAFAVAGVLLLPGTRTRRRLLIVIVSPIAGLVVLAALDLLTAHGTGHYTGSVLDAHSAGELRDLLVRRYGAAGREVVHRAMPLALAAALAAAAAGVAMRDRLLAPVGGDAAWSAAFAGSLTAGVAGSLVEDSGPVLFVVAVFTLGCVAAYLHGRPHHGPSSPGMLRESRSRALRPEAAPARSGS
jgi:hypothetical protein